MRPVKVRTRVRLAPPRARNVAVAHAIGDRIRRAQGHGKSRQNSILRFLERQVVGAFKFDADREIVTAMPVTPLGFACMPGAVCARHELDQFAITADKKVRRDTPTGNITKVRVSVRIKAVGKQLGDFRSAKRSRRKADVMDDQQIDAARWRAGIAIGRDDLASAAQNARVIDMPAALPICTDSSRAQLIPRRSIR